LLLPEGLCSLGNDFDVFELVMIHASAVLKLTHQSVTTSVTRKHFIPQAKVNSPVRLFTNSTIVPQKAGPNQYKAGPNQDVEAFRFSKSPVLHYSHQTG
jgi:hypothetical protein